MHGGRAAVAAVSHALPEHQMEDGPEEIWPGGNLESVFRIDEIQLINRMADKQAAQDRGLD